MATGAHVGLISLIYVYTLTRLCGVSYTMDWIVPVRFVVVAYYLMIGILIALSLSVCT